MNPADIPIGPVPCAECRFLREAKGSAMREHYLACGWWDSFEGFPLAAPWFAAYSMDGKDALVTRKQVYGPHAAEVPRECARFELRREGNGNA